ncbi:MAG: nucleotidyl transferase AbiEii/AbiGii toxin family protein [Erysipelotrichaceae bacterium]|nr:nucleotidyl transferase AbiEii/AbiGii toxin family protein [Erysipelotrichaceae bacterium]
MNITKQEEIMYAVMKAVFDSGIPISFKGSMVLKACLMEKGFKEETRHTVDIDGNWHSSYAPAEEEMAESIQKALSNSNINLNVSVCRNYGEGRSAGFEFTDPSSKEVLFSMDIDVNRPVISSQIYEIEGISFRGVSPVQMLADKVMSVSTDKVFRRIKDVIDLYYMSFVFEFNKEEILAVLLKSRRVLNDFEGFLYRVEDLKHSYDKFRFSGNINKVPFDEVYQKVKDYINDVIPNK